MGAPLATGRDGGALAPTVPLSLALSIITPRLLLRWLFADRVLRLLATVPVTLVIARTLGPEAFGQLGFALGLAGGATVMAQLGLDRQLRRDLAAAPERAGVLIGSAMTLTGAGSFVAVAGLHAYAWLGVDEGVGRQLLLLLAWSALPQVLSPASHWFQSVGHPRPAVIARNALLVAFASARLMLCWLHPSVFGLALLALGEGLLTAALVFGLLRRHLPVGTRLQVSPPVVAGWIREGWPAMLMVVVGSTFERIDLLWLEHLGDASELGFYVAAQRFSELWWSMATLVSVAVLPWLVEGRRVGEEEFLRRLQRYADGSLAATLTVAVLGSFVVPWGLPWVLGEAYRPASVILLVLLWTAPAVFSEMVRSQALLVQGRLGIEVVLSVCHLLLLSVACAWLVPAQGAWGAALARLAAFSAAAWFLPWAWPSLRGIARVQWRAWRPGFLR